MQGNSANFLGLPPELRLNIYEHVFQQQLDIRPLDGFRLERHYPPRPNGLQGSFVRVNDVRTHSASFSIPWITLMLSCKAVAQEISDFIDSSSYRNTESNRTYELELKPAAGDEGISLVSAAWCRIPCAPQQVRRLIIHNTGAAKTVMAALNLFLHCGLPMDRLRPLSQHLRLDDLMVNILSTRALAFPEQKVGFEPVDEEGRSKPEYEHVLGTLSNYHKMGKLTGYLGHVCVRSDRDHQEFDVVHPFKPGFVSFRWGVGTVS